MEICELAAGHCRPCEGGVPMLPADTAARLLGELEGWTSDGTRIDKRFRFKNHHEAMAFVNALAWISHREDHHPDVRLGYRDVTVSYQTHAIGGLTENDFICAAKVERLFAL